MSNPNDPTEEEQDRGRRENRFMLISVFVVVVLLLGGMGINMLVHRDTNAGTIETKSTRK